MYATDHTPGNGASLRHVPLAWNKCHRGTIYRARFHRSFDTSGKSGLATYTHACQYHRLRPGFDGLPEDCREISPQFAKRVFAMAFRERHEATACAKATGTAATGRPFAPAHKKALGQFMPISSGAGNTRFSQFWIYDPRSEPALNWIGGRGQALDFGLKEIRTETDEREYVIFQQDTKGKVLKSTL